MAGRKKKNQDCGELLNEHILKNYSGGVGAGLNDLTRLKVKCPVASCSFECNTFGEMNIHIRSTHPELC